MKRSVSDADTGSVSKLLNVRWSPVCVRLSLRESLRSRLWVSGRTTVGSVYVMDGMIAEMRRSKLLRRELRVSLVASPVPARDFRFLAKHPSIFWHAHRIPISRIDRVVPVQEQWTILQQTRPPFAITAADAAYAMMHLPPRPRGRNIETR